MPTTTEILTELFDYAVKRGNDFLEPEVFMDSRETAIANAAEQIDGRVEILKSALKTAREDLSIWHDERSPFQRPNGGIDYHPCGGCSTCEDTFPIIEAALAELEK